MATDTSISWTDHTFNPWIGCTKVSPGCDNCYAESLDRRWGGDHWGKGKMRRVTSDAYWQLPIRWNAMAGAQKTVKKVFCGSLCDVMDDEAPAGARDRLWQLVDRTPNLMWLLLSKRPHRYLPNLPRDGFIHSNVMFGATVEEQKFYAERMKRLHVAAAESEVRNRKYGRSNSRPLTFISYEPALGPLSIIVNDGVMPPDWLIFGGETGNRPRPMEQKWAEDIKWECAVFGVSFWMKQMSARTPAKAAELIPAELLLRQFPGGIA